MQNKNVHSIAQSSKNKSANKSFQEIIRKTSFYVIKNPK